MSGFVSNSFVKFDFNFELLGLREKAIRSEIEGSKCKLLNEKEKDFLKKKIFGFDFSSLNEFSDVSINNYISKLKSDSDSISAEVSTKETQLFGLIEKRKAALEKIKLSEDNKRLNSEIRSLNRDIQNLEGNIKTLNSNLSEIREKLDRIAKPQDRDEILRELELFTGIQRFNEIKNEVKSFLKAICPFGINLERKLIIRRVSSASFEKKVLIKDTAHKITEIPKDFTINVDEYLKNRVSQTALEIIKSDPSMVELFMGAPEEMISFYRKKGYQYVGEFEGTLSASYYLFKEPRGKKFTVVVGNLFSKQKFSHILLQHAILNVDVNQFAIRGDISSFLQDKVSSLFEKLDLPKDVVKVFFIGNTRFVLDNIGYLDNDKLIRRAQEGYKHLNPEVVGGLFPLYHKKITLQHKRGRKEIIVAAMKMPNGEAAEKYVKGFLQKHAVDYIVMVGAGGSLGKSDVGDYEVICRSTYEKNFVTLYPIRDKVLIPKLDFIKVSQGVNATVPSLLVETKQWLEKAQQMGITDVDVETYHIFKAMIENASESKAPFETKIVPGLFISDKPAEGQGLEEKISGEKAYKNLTPFIGSVISIILNDIEISLRTRQKKFDACFRSSAAKFTVEKRTSEFGGVANKHIAKVDNSIQIVNRMFDGRKGKMRGNASKAFISQRKDFVNEIFAKVVKPELERLLKKHIEQRSFDEMICIFGFNRLFTREMGSAGSDVDFMMLIDTKSDDLVKDIRKFMKEKISPEFKKIGIEMETADYLMLSVREYRKKLNETRKALFTLANRENVSFIAGSKKLVEQAFIFSNEEIAEHYCSLLEKHGHIAKEKAASAKKHILALTEKNKYRLLDNLRKMASVELYIGKAPYKGKKTVQTVLTELEPEKRSLRTAEIPIKYCFGRIADFIFSVQQDYLEILDSKQVKRLEKLNTILSNIKCRIDSEKKHPLLKAQSNYSNLTFEDIQKMNKEDRMIIAKLLAHFNLRIDPLDKQFPSACYDALWSLAEQMKSVAIQLEKAVYTEASNDIA